MQRRIRKIQQHCSEAKNTIPHKALRGLTRRGFRVVETSITEGNNGMPRMVYITVTPDGGKKEFTGRDLIRLGTYKKVFEYKEGSDESWLKVSLNELMQLDIHHQISNLSYMNDGFAYLSKLSGDAELFKRAFKKTGVELEIGNGRQGFKSVVRTYEAYNIDKIIKEAWND